MALFSVMWPITSVMQALPYWVAALWILISAFYDVTFVMQQSLFLCLYFYLANMLERFLCFYLNVDKGLLSTFINSATLAVLFAGLLGLSPLSKSSSNITAFIVLCYGIFLQLIEPILMFIEMVQMIRFIFDLGERLRNKVYDTEDETHTYMVKVLIILITVINFSLSLFSVYRIYLHESPLLSTIVFTTSIGLAVVSIYYNHIIIDASFMALYTSYLIYLASIESHVVSLYGQNNRFFVDFNVHPLIERLSWPYFMEALAWMANCFEMANQSTTKEQDHLLFSLLSRMELILGIFKKGFLSIALQLSPLFWVAFILRIKCLTSFLEGELCRTFFLSDEFNSDHEDDDDQLGLSHKLVGWLSVLVPSRSALVRISVVIGFTSVILQRFSTGALFFLARYQWMVRLVQTFTASIFYLCALRAFESDI